MQRVVEVRQVRLGPVDGQRIHAKIVGPDGEELGLARQSVRRKCRARRLDHDPQRRQRCGHLQPAVAQLPCDAVVDDARGPNLGHVGHHRQQHANRTVHAGAQDRGQLHREQGGLAQQQADSAQPERRVRVHQVGHQPCYRQGLDLLLAAPIEHADRHRVALHRLDDRPVALRLFVLVRHGVPIHEQELAPQQPDAHGPGLRDHGQLDRQLEVRLQVHRFTVQRHGRKAAQAAEALAVPRERSHGAAGGRQRGRAGIEQDGPGRAVQHHHVAGVQVGHQPRGAQHGRHAERPQQDGSMPVRAAFLGRDTGNARRVDQRGIARPQPFRDQDRARRAVREAAERRTGQVAHQPTPDLAHLVRLPLRPGPIGLGVCQRAGLRIGRTDREQRRPDGIGFLHHGRLG